MLSKFFKRFKKQSNTDTDYTESTANGEVVIDIDKDIGIRNEHSDSLSGQTGTENNEEQRTCLTASFSTVVLAALTIVTLILGGQYVKDMLLYIDMLDVWESTVLFAVMFAIVAFPIMWGYVLLNIAAGYTYGFLGGTAMASGCAVYAMLCAHLVIRRFFKGYVERNYIVNDYTKALMKVVSGPQGFKIVFLTRFTPLPFGLQNAVFAVSNIALIPYILSSASGLLVTQAVYAYMGSTFRSMAEIVNDNNSVTAWIVISVQILVAICLTAFIIRLAKRELDRAVIRDKLQTKLDAHSSQTELSEAPLLSQPRSRTHSRNMSVNIPPIVPQTMVISPPSNQ